MYFPRIAVVARVGLKVLDLVPVIVPGSETVHLTRRDHV